MNGIWYSVNRGFVVLNPDTGFSLIYLVEFSGCISFTLDR